MKKPNRKPNCKCSLCGKDIYRYPKLIADGPVFCSLRCSARREVKKIYSDVPYVNSLKLKLARERGGVCEHCQYDNFMVLNVHHIIERANGGSDDLSNLLLLCYTCHAICHDKGNEFIIGGQNGQ